MYEKYFKRGMDIILSLLALSVLSPLFLLLVIAGAVAMRGNPFFVQPRPGMNKNGSEHIFNLIKFRTMDNRRGADGSLLPDEVRLNRYGRFLRATSLDEFPEAINILKGDMSVVGPRPQLVRDMVFMTREQRKRHDVRPGLTGLAQINGRNNISWEQKIEYDLKYINSGITFDKDVKIILKTIEKMIMRSDVVREGTASDVDYGEWQLMSGKIDRACYEAKQEEAKVLLLNR